MNPETLEIIRLVNNDQVLLAHALGLVANSRLDLKEVLPLVIQSFEEWLGKPVQTRYTGGSFMDLQANFYAACISNVQWNMVAHYYIQKARNE